MSTANAESTPSTFAVFRNRDFSFLWSGQLVSTIGNSLTSVAASIVIFRQTGSALSVGLMLAATALPTLFVGPIAGVVVDRGNRKRIMIAADVTRAFLVVLIPILIPHNIAWLYVIVLLTSAVGQFYEPAQASVLPEIVSDEELTAANSFRAISSFGATALGFAAAGLIAAQYSVALAFYLDGVTFLVSALCIGFVRIPALVAEGRTTAAMVVTNLREGLSFLYRNPHLRSLMLVFIPVLFAFGLWNSLLLPFSERALNASEFEFGLQEAVTSIGFVIASFLMARYSYRLREGQWIVIGLIGMGIMSALYSRVALIPVAIALVMIMGFMNAPTAISRNLIIQRNTTREVRGRVNSAFFVARDVVFIGGMVAAGLADVIDIRLLVLAAALIMIGSGVLAWFLPGLGKPSAEWRQAMDTLRAAPDEPGVRDQRPASAPDLVRLISVLPVLSILSLDERKRFVEQAIVFDASPGTKILREGERGDDAYFVLAGTAVAGIKLETGEYRSLSAMGPGDFFGEIAALTGSLRTANVVVGEEAQLMQVPADELRTVMSHPRLKYLFYSKMIDRLSKTYDSDLPRLVGWNQAGLLEIRTPRPDDTQAS